MNYYMEARLKKSLEIKTVVPKLFAPPKIGKFKLLRPKHS